MEGILQSEASKKEYLQLANRVARLFKAILPDPVANELAPLAVLVTYLAAKIRAEVEQPDITRGDARTWRSSSTIPLPPRVTASSP